MSSILSMIMKACNYCEHFSVSLGSMHLLNITQHNKLYIMWLAIAKHGLFQGLPVKRCRMGRRKAVVNLRWALLPEPKCISVAATDNNSSCVLSQLPTAGCPF